MSAPALALELREITKRFGALQALHEASLCVRPGTVHALLGENGAGKTTLMRIAFGMLRPDSGTIAVRGVVRQMRAPADALASGIGMVHQHFTLVPGMTVAENLSLGGRGRWSARAAAARVSEIARRTGFTLRPETLVETLPVGAQQRVEIAKALAGDRSMLVLDEPTAVLAPAEAEELLRWLRAFADAGNAVVLITHKLREALAAADDVTVLRHGRVVLAQPARDATVRSLTEAMIGAGSAERLAPGESLTTGTRGAGDAVLRADDLVLTDDQGVARLRARNFLARAGEIVGVAGVEGAGQRELLRALAGRLSPESGRLERPERVGFVPEDRHHDAVLLDRTLAENVALRGAGARTGTVAWRQVRETTSELIRAFDVRAAGPDSAMRTLSGGNQQKLLLARELDARADLTAPERDTRVGVPRAIVLENPTRGLDVRATDAVHARLREARDQGAAIVVYSSDLDEVLALATRVYVAYAGVLTEIPCERDAVARAMLGAIA